MKIPPIPQIVRVVAINVLEDHAVDQTPDVQVRVTVNGMSYIAGERDAAFRCSAGRVEWTPEGAGYNLIPGDSVCIEAFPPEGSAVAQPPPIEVSSRSPPMRRVSTRALIALYLIASVLGAQSLHYRRIACGWKPLNYGEYAVAGLTWPALSILYGIVELRFLPSECPADYPP